MTDPTSRLVEMAFASLDEVDAWLRGFPDLSVSRQAEALIIRNKYTKFIAGFGQLAPIDAGIALALAVVGPYWSFALPTLINDINNELKRRSAAAPDRSDPSPLGGLGPPQRQTLMKFADQQETA
jgi:hypothetical protein